jgi:hypothetical protein
MRTAIPAFTIAVGLLISATADAVPRTTREEAARAPIASPALPPIIISVYVAPHIPASTVARLLAETDDIWRPNGFTFVWQRGPAEVAPYGRTGDANRYQPSTLRVTIDNQHGGPTAEAQTPLGWITFDRPDEPDQQIHVSYANAEGLLAASSIVVGNVSLMPQAQRELYVARALGRALAHELGHYLLASKAHTPHGLMQTARSAVELFGRERKPFLLDASQQQVAVSRFSQTAVVSRR